MADFDAFDVRDRIEGAGSAIEGHAQIAGARLSLREADRGEKNRTTKFRREWKRSIVIFMGLRSSARGSIKHRSQSAGLQSSQISQQLGEDMENWKRAVIAGSAGAATILLLKGKRPAGVLVAGVGLAVLASEYPGEI